MKCGLFIKSAGVLLLLTALAKLFTVFFSRPESIIDQHDPIFGIQFRHEFLSLGLLELAIACICLFKRPAQLQLGLIAWLGTCFAVYRLGLWSIGIHVCPCLGNFSDAIHLSNGAANTITLGILVYLLIGSYTGLLIKWLRKSA